MNWKIGAGKACSLEDSGHDGVPCGLGFERWGKAGECPQPSRLSGRVAGAQGTRCSWEVLWEL